MINDGVIISRPAQEDEAAMQLLRTLSIVSRRRWPKGADSAATGGSAAEEEGPRPGRRARPGCRARPGARRGRLAGARRGLLSGARSSS